MYKLLSNPNQIKRLFDGAIISQGNNGDWQQYQDWLTNGNTPQSLDVVHIQPNPMGFRSKLYGLTGTENNALYGVYAKTTAIAVTPATESAALTESRNILEGSFWNEPFSKPAFASAYNILKSFLTPEQIVICDVAIIEFNLS